MVWIKSIVARAASAPQQRLLALALLLLLAVGLIVRLTLASMMPHPGGSDFAFYYTVAENLVDGRGFQVDYIWNYLSAPETITHSSNDYWMPLTSLLISLPMSVLGKTIFVALLPSILTGLVLAVATYYLGKNYSDSNLVGLAAAFLTLFTPPLFHYSLRTDSTVYYALLCLSSLCLMTKGRDDPAFFLLAAACVGLAHLTRQDGVLLVVVLLAAILLAPLNRRAKFAYMLLSVVLYALILAPLLVSNYRSFGRLLPPGPAKTMYLQEYEDLYSYSKDLSLETFLDWGVDEIILSRMNALLTNAKTIYLHLGQAMSVLAVVGIGYAITQDHSKLARAWPPFAFLGALWAFYSLAVTFPGISGFSRSCTAVLPFLTVIAVDAIRQSIRSRTVFVVLVVLVGSTFMFESISDARAKIKDQIRAGQDLESVGRILENDSMVQEQRDIVIMTRNPWMVYHVTRHKAIQIPNDDIETIYRVAQRYGANYLLLPAPRRALETLYAKEAGDDRFQFVAVVPNSDLKLFRIQLDKVG